MAVIHFDWLHYKETVFHVESVSQNDEQMNSQNILVRSLSRMPGRWATLALPTNTIKWFELYNMEDRHIKNKGNLH